MFLRMIILNYRSYIIGTTDLFSRDVWLMLIMVFIGTYFINHLPKSIIDVSYTCPTNRIFPNSYSLKKKTLYKQLMAIVAELKKINRK